MDIIKRLLSRCNDLGDWWVHAGTFTKNSARYKDKEVRTANKLTVYATGDHLMYMADIATTYNQIMMDGCPFNPYDLAHFIALANPSTFEKLLDFYLQFPDLDSEWYSNDAITDEQRAAWLAVKEELALRVEYLEKTYVEPQEVLK